MQSPPSLRRCSPFPLRLALVIAAISIKDYVWVDRLEEHHGRVLEPAHRPR